MVLLGAVALLAGAAPAARATTFTVNSTADTADAAVGNGVCADSQSRCTLRAAIQEANFTNASDQIAFGIGTGSQTIAPSSALPTVSKPAVIDGRTQPG